MSEGLKDGVVQAQFPKFPLQEKAGLGGCRLILEALTHSLSSQAPLWSS